MTSAQVWPCGGLSVQVLLSPALALVEGEAEALLLLLPLEEDEALAEALALPPWNSELNGTVGWPA